MANLQQIEKALRKSVETEGKDSVTAKRLANAIKNKEYDDVEYDVAESIKNIPSSAVELGKDMLTAVNPMNWPSMASGMQTIGQGLVEKTLPEQTTAEGGFGQTQGEQAVDAVKGFVKDRYGSSDAIKRTAMNDPVGMLSDVAGVTTMATLPAKGTKIAKLAQAIDPVNVAVQGGKKVIGKTIPKSLPRRMYENTAKFSTSKYDDVERAGLIDTALDNQIMPTRAGIDKLNSQVRPLIDRVEELINIADNEGKTVPVSRVLSGIKDVKARLTGVTSPNSGFNERKINKVVDEWLKPIQETGRTEILPTELQKLKQNLYKQTT
jgi:hypothetical protein